MATGPGGTEYDQAPRFTGDARIFTRIEDTKAEAVTFAGDVVDGAADRFLGAAWSHVEVRQGHKPDGTFASWWVVTVDYIQPGPGDDTEGLGPGPAIPAGA